MKDVREARVIRYYSNANATTENDYIECLIKCYDYDEKKEYWGMTWSWKYGSMNKYAQIHQPYNIAEDLFNNLMELQKLGYKVTFESVPLQQ